MAETENSIKVVIRTRPTQSFATKNLNFDLMENVNFIFKNNFSFRE
ncbi:MAG: hypothetical protein MJ252_05440 [archaeon]|nr:hypothetical protein [archaeon]